ncbi:hypothetical protein QCA50_014550 [Cerrena zonata]|uniref:Uncharacterized protein n=1 Tax=Cerrena zonata TaxID=2478898 RepID=A0AAW0G017_9APHY
MYINKFATAGIILMMTYGYSVDEDDDYFVALVEKMSEGFQTRHFPWSLPREYYARTTIFAQMVSRNAETIGAQ